MASTHPSSLAGRTPALLIGAAVAIAVALGAMLLWFVHSERQSTIATGEAYVMGMTRAHAAALGRALADYERELHTLGEYIATRDVDSEAMTRRLHDYKANNAELMDLLVLDDQGTIVAWTQEGERPDVTDRDYFTAHRENGLESGGLHVSPPLESRVHDDRPFMAMSRVLTERDGSKRVLVLIIDIEQLARSLAPDTGSVDTTMVATTLDGIAYFRLPFTEEAPGMRLEQMASLESIEREMLEHVVSPFDGEEHIVGLRRLDPYPLAVVSGQNRNHVLAGETRKAVALGGLYLFALFLITAVTRLLVRLFREQETTAWANRERAKEAETLNTVIRLSLDEAMPTTTFLQQCVDAIPPGFQDPSRTAARIRLPDRVATSTPFFEGPQHLEAPLVVGEETAGSLEVFYAPESPKMSFLPEEHRLLKALAGHLGQALHRRAVLAEREAMRTELQRSNADLEQFAYAVSHDLREPLRMVNSYLGLLTRQLDSEGQSLPESARDRIQHYLDHARDGATRMDGMLLSLLEYSRVGRRGDAVEAHEARELVDEALAFLEPTLRETGATVEVTGEWPVLCVSRDEIVRLFQNLIGNALKYRADDTPPTIRIHGSREEAPWFRGCVEDNGIGIDPAQRERLFNVFSRLHTREEYQGHGVGLALCRRIAEHHGGTMEAESDGIGHGSRFCVRLPAVVDTPGETAAEAPREGAPED